MLRNRDKLRPFLGSGSCAFFPTRTRACSLKIKLPYVFQFTLLYASGIFLILLCGNLTVSTLSFNFVTARRTFPDLSWAVRATHYLFHLISESLTHQCIQNWVDRRVEQDHKGSWGVSQKRIFEKMVEEVIRRVGEPGYSKNGTHSYDHQCDSLAYPQHTLKIKVMIRWTTCIFL